MYGGIFTSRRVSGDQDHAYIKLKSTQSLARIEFEHFMYKMALASAEKGIHCIDQDPSIKKQLPRLRIALMQLQAELAWRLRELVSHKEKVVVCIAHTFNTIDFGKKSVDELIALNNEILVEIKIYFTDLTQRLHQLQVVYERMTQIYYYFERKDDYHQWSELLKELEKNYQENRQDDEEDEVCQISIHFSATSYLQCIVLYRAHTWIIGAQHPLIMRWTPKRFLDLWYQKATSP